MVDWSWRALRRNTLTTPVLLRSIPVGVVIAAGVLATGWTHRLLADHQDLVVHTFQAIDNTKDVLIGLDDAETGQRGYLLSGDRRYLEPYDKALGRLWRLRGELRSHISDNAAQVARVTALDTLVDTKLAELKDSIALHDTQGFQAARDREIAMMERATMDRIRAVIGEITRGETTLLAERQSEVDRDERRIRWVAVAIALASFLTRAGVEIYLARRERRRDAQEGAPPALASSSLALRRADQGSARRRRPGLWW
ncbi:CHASE3 domain-containing protein [Aureimonas jatrophae]|uniref:Methyl-accepting chemotaxis protein n=1 Tax=Aureimonas jatrophae TaxID=1166073 RepID=A0A1H0EPK0_9HYPH|nr:CHASE3 domain-containing protein [Aureimonas jatrophae]MBB3950390.1 methyl-accepting chemotaxis protein [Aureimonas jatrophae]SDN84233.1 methyl-accepting chemotaxis protein [Aureimonas jatrophae]